MLGSFNLSRTMPIPPPLLPGTLIDGRPASYDDPVIMVGAAEVYEARCRQCHEIPGKDRQ